MGTNRISVVVPIYNVERYLEKCIDSILAQSYKDIEVVLVDDGSTDSSGKICDEYGKKDGRVVIIHKTNGGLVSARKAGLEVAAGAFIGCVDADDWIEADYYEHMAQAQKESGADLIVSGHFHDIGEDSKKVCGSFAEGTYSKEQLLSQLLYSGNFFEYGIQPHMVTKLFRKEILLKTQLCVDERIVVGEDAAVVYPSILEAEKICITGIYGYHYVQHEGSITKKELKDETGIYQLLFEHLEKQFREKGIWEIMNLQMEQYKKYLLFIRQMQHFDEKVLLPYGGIPQNSRIIIYGAGVLGQKMYKYLSQVEDMSIVLWVDKNFRSYIEKGMDVKEPEAITKCENYDYILIANTVLHTAEVIKKYLLGLNVVESKIKWFTPDFIEQNV